MVNFFSKYYSTFIAFLMSFYFLMIFESNPKISQVGFTGFIVFSVFIAFFLVLELFNNNQSYKKEFFNSLGQGILIPSSIGLIVSFLKDEVNIRVYYAAGILIIISIIIIGYSIKIKNK